MELFADPTIKGFNILGVYAMSLDVQALEDFASRCGIENLTETFSEIRQMVDLFLSGDVEQFLDPYVRRTKYPHLSPSKVVGWLDRYVVLFAYVL